MVFDTKFVEVLVWIGAGADKGFHGDEFARVEYFFKDLLAGVLDHELLQHIEYYALQRVFLCLVQMYKFSSWLAPYLAIRRSKKYNIKL